MANSLSNDWNDVTLVKLDSTPGSEGPLVVMQKAVAPDDTTQTPCTWLLRKDGRWIRLIHQVVLDRAECEKTLFGNAREVMELLGSLPEKPECFEMEMDPAKQAEALSRLHELSAEKIRELAREWKHKPEQ